MGQLHTYDEVLSLLLQNLPDPAPERVPLEASAGRILATAVEADLDLPPFDRVVMDGYAVRSTDVQTVPCRLRVVGDVVAGDSPEISVGPNEAVRIMTGAPLPRGADAVQMVEKTVQVGTELVEILEPLLPGQNVAARASEVQKGAVVLRPGERLDSIKIGVLAAFGQQLVDVFRLPRAVIIPTGTELVDVSDIPGPGQIRNSNAFMLKAQCTALGIDADVTPPLGDDRERTAAVFEEFKDADLMIFSGGVSMGDRDYVHMVIKDSDARVVFHKAAIKPGKPVLFARRANQVILGLPGNPVSSFVTFELFVRPAARALSGWKQGGLPRVTARLEAAVSHKPGRLFFKPALLSFEGRGFAVTPIETKGSADLVAFRKANSLLMVPADATHLDVG
ncbi:MAG TPA: gephyrin-like molybdotransferase Glp, partial [Acidobacteriota bacterium]|nr:gephyrin-like molybdotransferase Glp [Acidobacteriota bacterium]